MLVVLGGHPTDLKALNISEKLESAGQSQAVLQEGRGIHKNVVVNQAYLSAFKGSPKEVRGTAMIGIPSISQG